MSDNSPRVFIIGSGPAGAIPAVFLSQKGMKVTLFEGGDYNSNSRLNEVVANLDIQGIESRRFNFSKELGGSSNLWSGRTSFFEEVDFKINKWPMNFKDLNEDIEQAKKILKIDDVNLEEVYNDLNLGPLNLFLKSPFSLKPFILQETPFNSKDYLNKNSNNKLSVHLKASLKKLVIDENNNISELIFNDSQFNTKLSKSDYVILAAGGLETPRVLLNSGFKNKNIGKFFSTHPKMSIGTLKLYKRIKADNIILADKKIGNKFLRCGIGLTESEILRKNSLNHYFQILPKLESFSLDLLDKVKEKNSIINFLYEFSSPTRLILVFLGKVYFKLVQRFSSWFGKYKEFDIKIFCDQYCNSGNQMILSDIKDNNGLLKINLQWQLSEEDIADIKFHVQNLVKKIEFNNIGKVFLNENFIQEKWDIVGLHSHFMGMTRMGDTDEDSVVDSFGKMHETNNLYISGPSLYSGYGYANPFFPIIVFSLRTSRRLLELSRKS